VKLAVHVVTIFMGWKPIRWREKDDASVIVARADIQAGATALYSRVPMSKGKDIRALISHKEEILNHVFNLTFAIAGRRSLRGFSAHR
jgi:hypothetical protein